MTPSLILACVACAGAESPSTGTISASVHFLTAATQITRVSVSIAPAGFSADLTVSPGDPSTFTGVVTVPAGLQTITVTAFASNVQVGTGSATVTVVTGQQAQVDITVVDTSGPPGVPDHSPVVTSFVVPASTAQVGDHLSVSSSAFDQDGDAIALAWTAAPPACGSFDAPASAAATFTALAAGPCTITLTATARGKSDDRSATVQIGVATGTVGVTVTYVPQPLISNIALFAGATRIASISRTGADATTHAIFHRGTAYTVTLTIDPAQAGGLSLSDSCHGTIAQPSFIANSTTASGTWTPTVSSGACVLTAQYTRQTLADTFPIVVLPVP